MKVWVVMHCYWDGGECVGVFSSKALAEAFIKAFPDPQDCSAHEHTVDNPASPIGPEEMGA